MKYEQPRIAQQHDLSGRLQFKSQFELDSDAEIKHGVEPVEGYRAPEITEQRDLDGRLQFKSDRDV